MIEDYSKWGCVDSQTEILAVGGFKKYNELTTDDSIYTWCNGKLNINKVRRVIVKEYEGSMHSYLAYASRNNCISYEQMITPEHRTVIKKYASTEYSIKESRNIFKRKYPYAFPVGFNDNILNSEEYIKQCKKVDWITLATEALKPLGEPISDWCLNLSPDQTSLFLKLWSVIKGRNTAELELYYANQDDADKLQEMALRTGYCSYIVNNETKEPFIKVRDSLNITPTKRIETEYKGIVWCPNVVDGTAVFRRNGAMYISGQCQAPSDYKFNKEM